MTDSILLDTHVWLWYSMGSNSLARASRQRIDDVIQSDSLYLAAISVWELAMLQAKGRIVLDMPLSVWAQKSVAALKLQVLPLSPQIAIESSFLPGGFHGDPADRMIVATARVENLVLATGDQNILAYAKKHHVRVLRA